MTKKELVDLLINVPDDARVFIANFHRETSINSAEELCIFQTHDDCEELKEPVIEDDVMEHIPWCLLLDEKADLSLVKAIRISGD